ncbi:MAG: flagellar basal-body MS-ring/collar protein FliF, partial [Vicinamibacterales bacterium]
MNPEDLLAHLKRLTASLSWQQIGTLAGVFVAVVGVLVGTAYWINAPTYTVLFSDMDSESASSVVSRLKTDKVDYQLDEGGRTIRVPLSRVDELRLSFSSQGMPTSGRIGFEIFDRTAFGTTEFLEHVNYRRALEGELARTIGTIAEVSSARVHIAMAKDSLFATDKQSAKASVVLKLKGRKPLQSQTISAIAGLVASSVEDLRPESVVVLDTFGRSLTGKGDSEDQDVGGLNLDKQHRLERDLTTKVVALLEPIVGEGHVRVNVAARLNTNSAEETEERWDPATVLRSRQTSSDIGATPVGALLTGGGTVGAGARANTPPGVSSAPAVVPIQPPPPGTPPSRTVESTNYEVGRMTRHTISPSGQVARLSVAVLIDDSRSNAANTASAPADAAAAGAPATPPAPASKPRSPEEIERIHKLVSAAVGFEEARGDQLTVENISFDEGEQFVPEPPKSMMQRVTTVVQSDGAFEAGRTLGVVLLAVLAFFMFLRPVMNRALTPQQRPMSLPSAG